MIAIQVVSLGAIFYLIQGARKGHSTPKGGEAGIMIVACLGVMLLLCDSANKFQQEWWTGLNRMPMQELIAGLILIAVAGLTGFNRGTTFAEQGEASTNIVLPFIYYLSYFSLMGSMLIVGWPWAQIGGQKGVEWMPVSPFSIPLITSFTAAIAFLLSVRMSRK